MFWGQPSDLGLCYVALSIEMPQLPQMIWPKPEVTLAVTSPASLIIAFVNALGKCTEDKMQPPVLHACSFRK